MIEKRIWIRICVACIENVMDFGRGVAREGARRYRYPGRQIERGLKYKFILKENFLVKYEVNNAFIEVSFNFEN